MACFPVLYDYVESAAVPQIFGCHLFLLGKGNGVDRQHNQVTTDAFLLSCDVTLVFSMCMLLLPSM